MKTYKIEVEEIDDEEYKEIRFAFTSYLCKIWEDNEFLGETVIRGVNAMLGLKSVLAVLKKKIFGEDDEYE
jgi:hypothetical protein